MSHGIVDIWSFKYESLTYIAYKKAFAPFAHLMRVAQYTFHTDWSKKDNFVLYFKGFQKRLGYNKLHK